MGNLSSILGNAAQAVGGSGTIGPPSNDDTGYLGTLLGGGPSTVPVIGTPTDANSDATAVTQGTGQSPDTWHPREAGFIGKLADAYLQSYGMAPAFQKHVDERNLQEAVGDFQSNPMQAIGRLAKIPGQELNAIKLYQQYQASQSTNQQRQITESAKKDLVYNRIGAMLQAATPQTYPAMKTQVENYVKTVWGMDPKSLDLPETYDPAQISALTYGAIKPADLIKEQGRDARQLTAEEGKDKRQGTAIDFKEKQLAALTGYRKARLDMANEDLTRKQQIANLSAQKLQEYINSHKPPKVVQTPNGMMELSPSGVTGRIGDQIWQKTAAGQWTRIK
jgi:hypothetical protein